MAFPTAFSAACFLAVLPQGYALPTGGQVIVGDVSMAQAGSAMTLTQASRHAIVNWQSFNLGVGEQLRLQQNGADAAMLARVIGSDPSQLLGALKADGKLFLINRNGILVGAGATIDTAAFIASTLDVADADFLAGGPLTFKGDSTAGVVNLGKITAHEGNVLLLAHTVKNTGEISAANGTAGLGAGTEVYIASPDDAAFTIRFNLPASTEEIGVENAGLITAAQAELKAAGGSIYDLAVNHRGIVHATGAELRPDGRVVLTAQGGTVSVSGEVAAQTASRDGGEILIGGDYQGANAAVPNAARTLVTADAKLTADAAAANRSGGRVVVWADDRTRFFGALSAKGGAVSGDGGFAEVSGKRSLWFTGATDLSAVAGKQGTLLLDPDDIVIDASGTLPANAADRFWSEAEDTGGIQSIGASALETMLANGDVQFEAANSIVVNAPVNGGASGVSLTLRAATITFNASLTLHGAGNTLALGPNGNAGTGLTSASNATVSAPRIRVGFGWTHFEGPVVADRLEVTANDGVPTTDSFRATNSANAIGRFSLASANEDFMVGIIGDLDVRSGSSMSIFTLLSESNSVSFSAAGDLTLEENSVLTSSGTMTLAATDGGVFINRSDANALQGAGRKRIYTSDTDGAFTLNGLAGFTQVDGTSHPSDPSSSEARILYRAAGTPPDPDPEPEPDPEPSVLTIKADDFTKRYGQPDPVFTATIAGGSRADLTLLPRFTILEGEHVNVGNYTIVPFGATSDTHVITYSYGTLRIDPATLTYFAFPIQRIYGSENPILAGAVTGFVNNDTLAGATTGELSFSTLADSSSHVGQYAIVGTGLEAKNGNYVFQQAAANATAFTILPATLTYVADPASRLYGDANPTFSGTVTGFVLDDTLASATTGELTFESPATPRSDAGNAGVFGAGLTANHGNYVFEQAADNATALTIAPAPLTIKWADATRTYQSPDPEFTATFIGLKNDETPEVLGPVLGGTTAHSASPVGSYPIGGVGNAGNYRITVEPGTLTILPAPLTLTVKPAAVTFGDPLPAFDYTLQGLRGGDAPSVLSGVTFATSAVTLLASGEYAVLPTSAGAAQNYVVTDIVPGTLTVNRRPVAISVDSFNSVAGLVPPLAAYASSEPIPGGPQWTLEVTPLKYGPLTNGGFQLMPATLDRHASAGDYVLQPTVVPETGSSLEELERYYRFTFFNGRLSLASAGVDPALLHDVVIQFPHLNDDGMTIEGLDENVSSRVEDALESAQTLFDDTTKNDVKVAYDGIIRLPPVPSLPPQTFSDYILENERDLMAQIDAIVGRLLSPEDRAKRQIVSEIPEATDEEERLLWAIYRGEISLREVAARMATDTVARSALLPLLMKDLMFTLENNSGLTPAQLALAKDMTERINAERARLAAQARAEFTEWKFETIQNLSEAGLYGMADLQLMPDIVSKVKTESVNRAVEAIAIGVGVGAGVGGAASIASTTALVSLASSIFYAVKTKVEGVLITTVTATQIASWAAAGVSATLAISSIIITTAVAEVINSENNRASYEQFIAANDERLTELHDLNLGNEEQRLELARAFAVSFGESFASLTTPSSNVPTRK